MRKETAKQAVKTDNNPISGNLIGDIRSLIETARHNVVVTVNAGLTILYWQIGNRIHQDILKEKGNLYLLKKEKMALSLFMDQMELSVTTTDQLLKNHALWLDGKVHLEKLPFPRKMLSY